MKKAIVKKGLAGLLTIAMVVGMLPGINKPLEVQAAEQKAAVKDINLNIDGSMAGIGAPAAPDESRAWSGSKVYFGTYDDKPILFRVLDAKTTDYNSSPTMLLDCDTILEAMEFGGDNTWSSSTIKTWMNENLLNEFTAAEKNTIAESTKVTPSPKDGDGWLGFSWCGLSNVKVFALDAKEATNTSYGYSGGLSVAANRAKKKDSTDYWWLRSAVSDGDSDVGVVTSFNGTFMYGSVHLAGNSVSPALNLNLSSVLFTSASGAGQSDFAMVGSDKASDNTWKLTLKDGDTAFKAAIPDDGIKNNQIKVNVHTKGSGSYNQTSAILADSAGTVIAYGKVGDANTGDKTVPLPAGLSKGAYTLHVFLEQVNGKKETNYASKEMTVPIIVGDAAKPEITADLSEKAVSYTKGTKAKALTVAAKTTDGGKLRYQWYKNSRKSSSGAVKIGGATGASYNPPTKTTGKSYYYCIVTNTNNSAAGTKTASAVSKIAAVTVAEPPSVKPAAPKITVSPTYNSAKVSWKSVKGASGYQVYRASSKNGSYKKIKTTTAKSWIDKNLTAGKTYYYKVQAYKKQSGKTVYGSFSGKVKAIPRTKAPNFKLTPGNNRMKVCWSKVSGADGYQVYRAKSKSGKYKMVKDSRSRLRCYTSVRLTDHHTYYYKLRSYKNVKGKKVYSVYTKVKGSRTK